MKSNEKNFPCFLLWRMILRENNYRNRHAFQFLKSKFVQLESLNHFVRKEGIVQSLRITFLKDSSYLDTSMKFCTISNKTLLKKQSRHNLYPPPFPRRGRRDGGLWPWRHFFLHFLSNNCIYDKKTFTYRIPVLQIIIQESHSFDSILGPFVAYLTQMDLIIPLDPSICLLVRAQK